MFELTSQDRDFYQQNGVVILRQAIAKDWIELLKQGVEKNFAAPSEYACDYTPKGQPGAFYDDYCNWETIAEYKDFIFNSNLGKIAGQLLQPSQTIRLFHEHVLVKEPGTVTKTPWHQDYPYYCVDGDQGVSFWIPLDEIDSSNKLEFIAGSHRWGKIFEPKKFNGKDKYDVDPNLYATLPEIDGNRTAYNILSWTMQPGDVIAFNFKTIHGNSRSSVLAKQLRRAFSCRLLGDEMVYTSRPGEKSPPFPGLDLKPGEKLVHDKFPVIWAA